MRAPEKKKESKALCALFFTLLIVNLPNYIEGGNLSICKEDPNLCPHGYIYNPDLSTCYELKTEPRSSWGQARDHCVAEGGDLASVTSSKENAFIKELFQAEIREVWMGLRASDGMFSYNFSFSDHEELFYRDWFIGNPNTNLEHPSNCVEWNQRMGYHWTNTQCSERKAFVCKIKLPRDRKDTIKIESFSCPACPAFPPCPETAPVKVICPDIPRCPEAPLPVKVSCPSCPKIPPCPDCKACPEVTVNCPECPKIPWSKIQKAVYQRRSDCPLGYIKSPSLSACYFYNKKKMNWNDARKACQKDGGDLLSLRGQLEVDFVEKHVDDSGYKWIGLNSLNEAGKFVYTDGTDPDLFPNWLPNQPDNAETERCVDWGARIDDAAVIRWNNYRCHEMNPSICKIRID